MSHFRNAISNEGSLLICNVNSFKAMLDNLKKKKELTQEVRGLNS